MNRIFVWFALASFTVAAAAASCSINRRSGQYECDDTADCDPGRVCSEGLCVPAGGVPDAGVKRDAALPDANACPPQCTSCMEGKVCLIDCASPTTNCNNQIVCPAGFNCNIRCTVGNLCRSGINCTSAASCTILCSAPDTCRGVACGPGRCNVTCSGARSCQGVTCGTSCACDVRSCNFTAGSCQNVMCTSDQCRNGLGCSSLFPGCNTCP